MFSVKLDNRELNQLQITLIKKTVCNAKKSQFTIKLKQL